ncbi:Amidase [alpha proteobacterium BAL199]|jgi:aspartyl-tRNA(Asn)/glutamyl-tRNA(Gln) amidotransferase subunit A|nr:Amidase [alpha proteobacterium BAL199]
MAALPQDPFESGIIAFAADLRGGRITAAEATDACLARIAALNPKLDAFQLVDADRARQAARAVDEMLAAGTDLGPLMGVPIAVKDIIAVDGLPTTNGSLYPSAELTGPEGPLIGHLKASGCIILGKTKTVEFALGATGVNEARGTPWNPWDSSVHRIPGGSSSGSAVAVASGMCGFALGTDTGGSIRIPASFTGLFGHKTTVGLWPTDGVFPLSPTLDSIGPLCRSAGDAALIHAIVTGESLPMPTRLAGLKLGRPTNFFFDELDDTTRSTVEAALLALSAAGVEIVDIEIPEVEERARIFAAIVPAELVARLTPEGFAKAKPKMDPVTGMRAAHGLEVSAIEYASAQFRLRELEEIADEHFDGLDGWIAPSTPFVAMPVDTLKHADVAKRAMLSSRNTQPANIFGICAASLPIQQFGAPLPVGLQLMAPRGEDARLLSMAMAFEPVLGVGTPPDLSGFLE